MKMNRVLMVLCVVFGVLLVQPHAFAQADGRIDWDTCSLPSSVVKITVKQVPNEPVYEFTVTNLYEKGIFNISIGSGPKGLLYRSDELIPLEFVSPAGWEGKRGGIESPYLFYFWHINKHASRMKFNIKPGQTLSGFKLVMREPLEIIKVLPFSVCFDDLLCACGTVVEEK